MNICGKIEPLAEFHHHRVGVRRAVDPDLLLESFVISPVQFAEAIGLRCGDSPECLARDILDRTDLVVDHKDLLVVGKRRHSVPVFPALDDDVGEDRRVHHGPDPVMYDDDIVIAAFSFKVVNSVADGFLSRLSAGHDPLELVDSELPRVSAHNIVPSVDTDDFDGVDLRMPLKALQCIDQNGLVIYIYKLLGNVVAHSVA